ncbi:hypothetical protein WMY93_007389 [Mugilogobius chulae]|uniref:Uncharacterized protein n=1 Tax=Mugilogobius chulae TaxID=88201 RepID=A0AAW0PRH6_9GOBI
MNANKSEISETLKLAQKLGLKAELIELKRGKPSGHKKVYYYRLTVENVTALGEGHTTIAAKTQEAQQVLPRLRNLPVPEKVPKEKIREKKSLGTDTAILVRTPTQ